MDEKQKENKIVELKRQINIAEESLEAAKRALFELTKDSNLDIEQPKPMTEAVVSEGGKIIEGTFNGENMIGPEGKVYPVPANYASKSKLVEGDRLKLTIADDGSFMFKQISPVKRKNIVGTLKFEDNAYHVLANGEIYNILYASVTYHKGKPGDKVTITIPENGQAKWAALENIIHDIGTESSSEPKLSNEEINTEETPEIKDNNESKLNIADIDIRGAQDKTSQIANQEEVVVTNNSQEKTTPTDAPLESISEMDI